MTNEPMKGDTPVSHALTDLYEIQDLQAKASEKTGIWLRKRGWIHTCQTPGSCWMWTKAWDGREFLVSETTATNIQEIWDTKQYAKEFPEDSDEE